jgi:antibiotic biosynthesis monooxygenase (ABM) superfamily enzyme
MRYCDISQQSDRLERNVHLGVAKFVQLAVWAVMIIVYGMLPFALNCPPIRRWVNATRPVYTTEPLKSLDEGLAIFRPGTKVDLKALQAKVNDLEGKVERLRRGARNQDSNQQTQAQQESHEQAAAAAAAATALTTTAREAHGYTHVFHNRVKWESLYDYYDILDTTVQAMVEQRNDDGVSDGGFAGGFKGLQHIKQSESDFLCVWKFAAHEQLEAWLASAEYATLTTSLLPLLEPRPPQAPVNEAITATAFHFGPATGAVTTTTPPTTKAIALTRAVDGISDVFVNAPEAAPPTRPPPVWKNCILISFSLTTVILPSIELVAPFFVNRVGVKSPFLMIFIMVHWNTLINGKPTQQLNWISYRLMEINKTSVCVQTLIYSAHAANKQQQQQQQQRRRQPPPPQFTPRRPSGAGFLGIG